MKVDLGPFTATIPEYIANCRLRGEETDDDFDTVVGLVGRLIETLADRGVLGQDDVRRVLDRHVSLEPEPEPEPEARR